MIALTILASYALGWTATATLLARSLAQHHDPCKCRTKDHYGYYRHCVNEFHWHGDGTIGMPETVAASLLALLWPVLLCPALAHKLATRRPTERARTLGMQKRIAELEQELGLGQTHHRGGATR